MYARLPSDVKYNQTVCMRSAAKVIHKENCAVCER